MDDRIHVVQNNRSNACETETKQLIDSLSDSLLILDRSGMIIEANQTSMRLLEYEEGELIGKSVFLLYPEEFRTGAKRVIEQMTKQHESTCVLDMLTKTGKVIPVETKMIISSWKQKEVLIAINKDLSELREKDLLLHVQHQELKHHYDLEKILLRLSSDLINVNSDQLEEKMNFVLQMIGGFEKVDRSSILLFNSARNEIKRIFEWCAPGVESQKELIRQESFLDYEWWLHKICKNECIYIPDVTKLPTEAANEKRILEKQSIQSILAIPVLVDNRVAGFLKFDSVTDTREWLESTIRLFQGFCHMISNALLRNEQDQLIVSNYKRYQNLLNAVPDLLFIIDNHGYIQDFKATQEDLLFLKEEEIIGSHICACFQGEKLHQLQEKIIQTLQTNKSNTIEYELMINNQKHYFEARLSRYSETEVIAIASDISERKNFEQQKSDFIDHIAHELRTPIATTLLMTELIGDDIFDKTTIEYWQFLKNEIQKQRLLIDEFLQINRIESENIEYKTNPVDLLSIIQHALSNFQPYLKKNSIRTPIHTRFTGKTKKPILLSNEEALLHIFNNLISNAIKFSPDNSSITITIQEADGFLLVSIEDEGVGIKKEDIPYLFQRFYRGSNNNNIKHAGTGLGLYIVKSLLNLIKGDISVSSELGKGSVFTVLLPWEGNENEKD